VTALIGLFKALPDFLRALPDLLKLVSVLQRRAEEAAVKAQIAKDVKTIHEAFDQNDAQKLNDLFKS
jgi:hypothetical protein